MTDSVNGAGHTSGNWFKQASSKTTKALKGFLHFGSVRKTSGNSPVKDARMEFNKPEPTPVHSRSIRQAKASELASIRSTGTARHSSPITKPKQPLLKADSVQEKTYNAQILLNKLYQSRANLSTGLDRATALKKKAGKEYQALLTKADRSSRPASRSLKFKAARIRFMQAVQTERTANKALNNLDSQINRLETAIERLNAAEDRQADRELKQLLSDGQ